MRKFLLLLTAMAGLACTGCEKEKKPEKLENGLYRALVPRLSDSDRKVEIFWMEPKGTKKPWPVVIYLHGHQEAEDIGGKSFHDWGVLQKARDLGYLSVGVSLPGYGQSSGPRDFAGPDSQQAVFDVIRALRKRPEVSENKIAIVGVSRGAIVAAKVGEAVAGIAGLVLISGIFELGETYKRWKADKESPEAKSMAEAFERESVMSDAGPLEITVRERSVLPVPLIQCPVLIFQGAKDPVTLPFQAEELVSRLKEKGVTAQAIIYPEAGHRIPTEAREREIEPFLKKVLGR